MFFQNNVKKIVLITVIQFIVHHPGGAARCSIYQMDN